jgi:hypothetical protein
MGRRGAVFSDAEVVNMEKTRLLQGTRWAIIVGILCFTQISSAETQAQDVEDGYGVVFDDELMSGDTINPWGEIQRFRAGYARVLLIRPRVDLRTQLLQSIEDL